MPGEQGKPLLCKSEEDKAIHGFHLKPGCVLGHYLTLLVNKAWDKGKIQDSCVQK